MTCHRCEGPMVSDCCLDLLSGTGTFGVNLWRCLCCGEVADPVILAHRAHRPPAPRDPRKRPRHSAWRGGVA
jgi:hypothetical protein